MLRPLHAGHGRHRLALTRAFEDEDRVDEVVRGQGILAHHATREVIATHPSHAGDRVGGTGGIKVSHGMKGLGVGSGASGTTPALRAI